MARRYLEEPIGRETFADLLERLGDVPLDRIRTHPAPGTATEEDVVVALEAVDKRLYELVEGVLVEKAMGTWESLITGIILYRLLNFLDQHNLGLAFSAAVAMRLGKGLVRIPDVAFVSWQRLPNGVPDESIASSVPNLVIDLFRRGNSRGEIRRKLRDYFLAGVAQVWIVHPLTETAEVYRAPDRKKRVGKGGALNGADILPGFRLSLSDVFTLANRTPPQSRKRKKPQREQQP